MTVRNYMQRAKEAHLLYQRRAACPPVPTEARSWAQILGRYRKPSHARSIIEIAITFGPLSALWALAWTALYLHYWWLCLLLAIPAAGFLVRLFMIQHDCGHGSFFHNRLANDWVGRMIGVLTLTPYDFWRRTHAMHHASCGHLERRGLGDVEILTVREYMALSFWGRLRYRVYRHPSVMFGIGPAYLFILKHRLPVGLLRDGWQPWLSTMATNFAIAVIAAGLIWLIGIGPFLFVHLPIMLLAGSVGVWLFYVQHQFEMTFWAHDAEWTFQEAALHGSSHYDLPGILRWFTANIGVHHVHHLASRIPYYRLPRVLRDYPELRDVSRLTLLHSFRCLRLVLWDESRQRLISFREMSSRGANDHKPRQPITDSNSSVPPRSTSLPTLVSRSTGVLSIGQPVLGVTQCNVARIARRKKWPMPAKCLLRRNSLWLEYHP